MNLPTQQSPIILIILAVLVLGAGAYMLFGQGGDTATVQTDASPVSEAEAVFLNLIAQIDPVEFDTSILEDPRFKILRDLRTPIQDEAIGRVDPFAPLSGIATSTQ